MNYQSYFLPYAAAIDRFLTNFFQQKTREARKITPVAAEMWRKLQKFIAGGKRIRGGLVKLGYECFGGKNQKAVLPLSAAIEITHLGLLIHDDLIDQDDFRHHQPTIHRQYEAEHQQKDYPGDPFHYGQSLAIVVADLAYYAAISLIATADFGEEKKNKVLNEFSHYIVKTIYGQALDVDLGYHSRISEEEVLLIHQLKTAQYTFVGPLRLGGILAGAKANDLRRLEKYSFPVGIAFQLQDDILGVFGDEEKLGKPVGSDIKEGKNTLLYTEALKRGNQKQQKRLRALWGKRDLTASQREEVRWLIQETGSFEYSQKLARQLVEKGKKAVPQLTENKELQAVFLSLADFIIEREK